MAKRISKFCKDRKKRINAFDPSIEEFSKACRMFPTVIQITKYLGCSHESLNSFLDKEHYKEEQDPNYKSAYVAAYKIERQNTKDLVHQIFLKNLYNGEVSASIFAMKAFNGMIEAKDIKHIELKKREVALRTNEYLTNLAHKFGLDFEQLKQFSEKYFKGINLDNI